MIEFRNSWISLSRDGSRRLDAQFRIEEGQCVALLGNNGSGKTTLLDVISGVRRVDSGEYIIEPFDLPIAYVVQDANSSLFPWRTVLSNVSLPARLRGLPREESKHKALQLLSSFRLLERAQDFPYKLSGGEKQVLNLARALCTPAQVLLLDEPFAQLNVSTRAVAKNHLEDFIPHHTVLFVTHDPADLDWPIDRFFLLMNSKVLEVNKSDAMGFLQNATS